MTGCGARLARLLALGLASLFVILMPIGILLHALGSVLFSADRMASVLTENLVASGRLQQLVVEAMLVQGGGALAGFQGGEGGAPSEESGQGAEFLSYLNESERARIVAILLNPEWTTSWIESAVSSFYEWIDSEDPAPRLQLDLAPLREQLTRGGLDEIIGLLVGSWPACTSDQLTEMERAPAEGEETPYLICDPPQPTRSVVMAYMDSEFRKQLEALPPNGIGGAPGTDAAADPQAGQMKVPLRALRALTSWGWLAPAALLGLIIALAVRSWRGLGAWWGVPLLLAGLLTALVLVVGDRQASGLLQRALARMEAPAALVELAGALADSLRTQVSGIGLFEAGVAGFGGVAMVVLSAVLPRPLAGTATGGAMPSSGPKKVDRVRGRNDPKGEESDADKPSGIFG
ncbi:MAG: hypothetical protein WD906_05655 [Anaerolineales bacterium]